MDENLNAQIGAAVRSARVARGVTQDDLARLLGVDRVTVSRYEGGKRTLPAPALVRIATYLQIPVGHLTPGTQPPPMEVEHTPVEFQLAPSRSSAEQGTIQTVVHMLEKRPDLVPTVLDLLETLLDDGQGKVL